MRRSILAAASFLLCVPVAAEAQIETNWASVGTVVAGLTTPLVLNPCLDGCVGSTHHSLPAKAIAKPAPHGSAPVSLRYQATPAFRQQALAGFIQRLRVRNPTAAQAIQPVFERNDYARVYDGIVAPYGMAGDDAANAVTAYLVLGWLIATGHQDVPSGKASVLAVRAQVAPTLAANAALTPEKRAALGEEMKILFDIAHGGWQGSLKDGSAQVFSDAVARQFREQFGIDMRRSVIDATGLHQH